MTIKPAAMLCPQNRWNIKCPFSMAAENIVVHNTANDVSARNEVTYMICNDDETSFHFAVDDKEVVQGLPLNRNGWHAGDGNGKGNRKGIGIEICYSNSGGERFAKAEKLAAQFIAQLLKERGWGLDRVTKHQDYSGKYCPHRTLDLGWQRFLNLISGALNETTDSKPTTSNKEPTNIYYRVKTQKHGWLSEVKNLQDYAGWQESPVIGFMVRVDHGEVKYRCHVKGVGWLPYVTGYSVADFENGYAGDGRVVDAIEIMLPGKKRAKYRTAPVNGNYYDWQHDNEKSGGQDGYAGMFGQAIGRVQVVIV